MASFANYSEIVIFQSKHVDSDSGWTVVETNLTDDKFRSLMAKVARDKRHRFYEKEFKCYTKGDILCENRGNQDIRVFQRRFVRADVDDDRKFIRMYYDLSKIPYHQFPSTMHIHDISYVKRMSAKVHNRVSLHFESSMNPSTGKHVKRVYVSCNNEGNVDVDNLEKVVQNTIKELTF